MRHPGASPPPLPELAISSLTPPTSRAPARSTVLILTGELLMSSTPKKKGGRAPPPDWTDDIIDQVGDRFYFFTWVGRGWRRTASRRCNRVLRCQVAVGSTLKRLPASRPASPEVICISLLRFSLFFGFDTAAAAAAAATATTAAATTPTTTAAVAAATLSIPLPLPTD